MPLIFKEKSTARFALFIGIYVIINLIYAFSSNETWDDDCPTRYYNTVNAFQNPINFVNLWNRPLFTLIFAVPLQFGKFMIPILMTIIVATACLFLYKALKKQAIPHAELIAPFLLFQSYFFTLSRNAETEPLAVALIAFGYYFLVTKKWFWFALMAGLMPLARLELILLFPFWGIFLLHKDRMKYIVVMLIPFLLWNIVGGIFTGNFDYVFNETFGANNESNRYGHTSFGHYFQRYIYAIGPIIFFFFSAGFIVSFQKKIQYKSFVFLQFLAGFMIYVLFSWKFNMGNAAGFMRNLAPLSVFTAIIALYGFNFILDLFKLRYQKSELKLRSNQFNELSDEEFRALNRNKRQSYLAEKKKYEQELNASNKKAEKEEDENRKKRIRLITLWTSFVFCLILVSYAFFSLEMRNHHKLMEDSINYTNFYFILGIGLFTLILCFLGTWVTKINTILVLLTFGLITVFTSYTEPPGMHSSPERATMEDVSNLFQAEALQETPLYVNHIWFFWSNDLDREDPHYQPITMKSLDTAEVGSICIWENHYSNRLSGDVQLTYFSAHKEWVQTSYYFKDGNSFVAYIYEKTDTNNLDSGIDAINRFVDLEPERSETWTCLGNYYQGVLHQSENAIEAYSNAIQKDSLNYNAHHSKGFVYFAQKEYTKAITEFKNTVRLKQNWPNPWVNLGAAYANIHQADSAILAYNKALKLDNKMALAYLNRGKMYQEKSDTMAAINDYNSYLSFNPNDPDALSRRIQLNVGMKNWELAATDIDRLVQIQPKNDKIWFFYGIIHYNRGKLDLAKTGFTNAANLGNPVAQNYLLTYFNS